MSIESHVDRTDYGPVVFDVLWHNLPGHPKWYGYNFSRETSRHRYDRPASVSTPKFYGVYSYPTRYRFASLRRSSKNADFLHHGSTECLRVTGPLSLRDATGGDGLFVRGLDVDFQPVVPDYLVAASDGKCLDGIQVNMAENMATFNQTMSLLTNLTADGLSLLAEFKRLSKGILDTRKVAKLWLEYQYGIRPLISDIVSAQHFDFKPAGFFTSKGQASKPFDRNVPNLAPVGYEVLTYRDGTRHGCNTQVAYTCDDPALAALSSLGLANPALLFWELTPFSFIADWFINVGQVVSTLSTSVGLTFLWGSRTRWHKLDYEIQWKPLGSGAFEGSPYGEIGSGMCFTREVLDSFPVPPLVWHSRVDLTKLTNAMAIVLAAL